MADSTLLIAVEMVDNVEGVVSGGGKASLQALLNTLNGVVAGVKRARQVDVWVDGAALQHAYGTVTLNAVDVDDTAVINGVTFTAKAAEDTANAQFDQSGTATVAATSLVACLRASTNALIAYEVEACNFKGSFACASVTAGEYVELTLSDGRKWRFTAVSGTATAEQFDISGNDTADGAALAAAINAMPGLNREVFAINSSGTVTVHQRRGTSSTVTLAKVGANITLVANAASAVVAISALRPGVAGNSITLVGSDADVTMSGAQLTGGTGNNVTKLSFTV